MTVAYCSVEHEWQPGENADWFTIQLLSEGKTLKFCPRHAMAAEVLVRLGLGGHQIVHQLKQYEKEQDTKRHEASCCCDCHKLSG